MPCICASPHFQELAIDTLMNFRWCVQLNVECCWELSRQKSSWGAVLNFTQENWTWVHMTAVVTGEQGGGPTRGKGSRPSIMRLQKAWESSRRLGAKRTVGDGRSALEFKSTFVSVPISPGINAESGKWQPERVTSIFILVMSCVTDSQYKKNLNFWSNLTINRKIMRHIFFLLIYVVIFLTQSCDATVMAKTCSRKSLSIYDIIGIFLISDEKTSDHEIEEGT